MDDVLRQRIEDQVKSDRVFLYMKGSPNFPQCGFSGQAVALLNHYETTFDSFDVLQDMDIRQGIKEFSDWPTIPQLYVDGEFIGGCDILIEMHEAGELGPLLQNTADAG